MLQLLPDRTHTFGSATLNVLLKITPPAPRAQGSRPPLNLALVLDRSGSMHSKMPLTRLAAARVVRAMQADDRLSLVTFSDKVHTLLAGARVTDVEELVGLLEQIDAQGNTALFDGWNEGAQCVLREVQPERLNRVMLLTDGEANQGETATDVIAVRVAEMTKRGVQTSTFGFGDHYNEDLLRVMAAAGEANHFYIRDQHQLAGYFETELSGLMQTLGRQVRVQLEAPGARLEWMAEVECDAGGVKLADLVAEQPLGLVARLFPEGGFGGLIKVRLGWHNPQAGAQEQTVEIRLPAAESGEEWRSLPVDLEVAGRVAVALVSRARSQAMALLKERDERKAISVLKEALKLEHLPDPDRKVLEDLLATVQRGDYNAGYKKSAVYGHGHGHGRMNVDLSSLPTQQLFDYARISVGPGPLLRQTPRGGPRSWRRLEGMLRGLFYGDRLAQGPRGPMGEAARLSLVTARQQMEGEFNAATLAQRLADAPVLHASPSLKRMRARLEQGQALDRLGGQTAGSGALRRVAPLLIRHARQPDACLWSEGCLATMLTHNDNLALVSSLGTLALLWDLLGADGPLNADEYSTRFQEAISGLEVESYAVASGRFKGWKGRLSQFLDLAMPDARNKKLSVAQVVRGWGSGPYLLELVPTLLYILERHGHEPKQALLAATTDVLEAASLGPLVGAAVGALHGPQADWKLEPELEEFFQLAAGCR